MSFRAWFNRSEKASAIPLLDDPPSSVYTPPPMPPSHSITTGSVMDQVKKMREAYRVDSDWVNDLVAQPDFEVRMSSGGDYVLDALQKKKDGYTAPFSVTPGSGASSLSAALNSRMDQLERLLEQKLAQIDAKIITIENTNRADFVAFANKAQELVDDMDSLKESFEEMSGSLEERVREMEVDLYGAG